MWEALEALFYWLKSRGKALPTPISLLLIGIVMILTYVVSVSHVPVTEPIGKEVSTGSETRGMQPLKTVSQYNSSPALVPLERGNLAAVQRLPLGQGPLSLGRKALEAPTKIQSKEPESYSFFRNFLEDQFQAEGIDRELAKELLVRIKMDHPLSGDEYDLRIPIRNVFKTSSDEEIDKIRDMVLEVSRNSFQAYSGLEE
jgi:hypothetical protein